MSSYVQHQSPPAPLFAGCPRRPSPRSAPRGRMDLNLFREHQAAFRAEFRPPFPIGPLTWGGVFVKFPFPPRTPPQPRSPIGLNSMPDCAPILGNLKRKCIIFFIHVCSEPKFTGWGRHQTDPEVHGHHRAIRHAHRAEHFILLNCIVSAIKLGSLVHV